MINAWCLQCLCTGLLAIGAQRPDATFSMTERDSEPTESTSQVAGDALGISLQILIDGQVVADRLLDDVGGPPGILLLQGAEIGHDWRVTWDLEIDPDPTELFYIDGTIDVLNAGTEPRDFDVRVEWPMCPQIDGPTDLAASVSIDLTTDEGGGMILGNAPPSVWRLLVDGEVDASLLLTPFFLSGSGQGSAGTTDSLGGAGIPVASPMLVNTIGIGHAFRLTGGEIVTFDTLVELSTDLDSLNDCLPDTDVNGDGVTNFQDMLILLSNWGECEGCPGDLNGDGIVDQADLLILLLASANDAR